MGRWADQTEPDRREIAADPRKPKITPHKTALFEVPISDQRLRTLHLNFEGGDQRIFRVNDNVSCFTLKFKANRKLHLCAPAFKFKR